MTDEQNKTAVVTLRFYIKQSDGTPGVTVQWEEDQVTSLEAFTPLQCGLVCAGVIKDKSIPDEVKKLLNDFGYWFHKGFANVMGYRDVQ
jgi:hypothetical protein